MPDRLDAPQEPKKVVERILLLSLAYLVAGWLGLQIPYTGTHITLVWLPTGIAVAALLRWGRAIWPGIYFGAFLVNLLIGSSAPLAAGIAIGNTLGPIVTVMWLQRVGFHVAFDRLKDAGLLIAGTCLGMAVSASGGVANLYFASLLPAVSIGRAWLTWWMGDWVGVLLAAPLLLTLSRTNIGQLSRTPAEFVYWILIAGPITWFAFVQDYTQLGRTLPLAFMTLPLIAWAALRFGMTGAGLSGLFFSVVAAWSTASGRGTFFVGDEHVGLLLLWVYMATTVLTGLLIAGLQAERQGMEGSLRANEQRLGVIAAMTSDLVYSCYRGDDGLFRIDWMSGNAEPVFGVTTDELIARGCWQPSVIEGDQPLFAKAITGLQPGQSTEQEMRVVHRDGSVRWVQSTAHVVDAPGNTARHRLVGALHDITERKSAEQALRDSEQRFRNLAENSADWIWALDLNGCHTYSNPNAARILGYTQEEFLPLDPVTLVHPDDLALFGATFAAAQASRSGWRNIVIRWQHKDGGYRMLESSATPVLDAQGQLFGFHGVDRDITERVRAEQERQRLASVLEATSDIVIMADPQGNILYLNGPGRALMGIAPDGTRPEVITKVHPRWAADLILGEGVPTAIREGIWSGETAVLGAVGEEIPVSQVILGHKDPLGNLLYLSTIMRDIRPIRAAEQSVRDSEERLRLALAAASQGLYDLDLTTGDAQVSPEYATMLGYDPATFKETNAAWRERLHPDDQATVYQAYEDYVAGRLPEYRVEFRQRTRDGGWKWVLSLGRIQERSADGRPLRMLGTHTDIDAIKAAEAALRELNATLEFRVAERTTQLEQARAQAESANRAKSAFLANMSHELRTPMNGVMGMIEMAKRRMTDPEGLDRLDKARLAAERLLGVLNDILDLSKIEAERMVLEDAPLQLADSVENIVGTLGHKATEKGLKLAVNLPAELARVPLEGDPLRLGQILLNLVGNAIKFTERGEVALRVRSVGETPEAVQVRFEVSDTGIGIDADAQGRLFQSFEQVDNSMTRKYGGTGLGLAICKRLVQLMGGEIGVESTPGTGSTFWFVVPLKKRQQTAVAPAPGSATLTAKQRLLTEFSGTRVLLAEDEPLNQAVLRFFLKDVNLVVDIADDGQQALELAKQNRYALILMDMQMPMMNGVDATRAIRANSLNQATPILAMTANAFDEDRDACLAAGMNEHISKPIDTPRLYGTLLGWLEKRGN